MNYSWIKVIGEDWTIAQNSEDSYYRLGIFFQRKDLECDPQPIKRPQNPLKQGYYWARLSEGGKLRVAYYNGVNFTFVGNVSKYSPETLFEICDFIGDPK